VSINTNLFQKFRSNKRLKQIASLFSVNIIGIPIGMVTSILLTRYLGAKSYGDFMFINNLINLAVIIGTFGIFQAGNRAIVLTENKEKIKEYYGAEMIFTIGVFLIVFLFLFLFVNYDPNINTKGLRLITLIVMPFSWVYILVKYFEVLFQADNRIGLLVKTRLFPKIFFLALVLLLFFFYQDYNDKKLILIFYCFIVSQIIVFIYIIFKIKLSFNNLKLRLKEIWDYNKSFGFHVYIGSVFAVGFAQLTGILISYFGIDNSGVGFYALALTIAAPLSFIPNTIATTHYKDFSKLNSVPKKVLFLTLGITIITLFLSWILISPFIKYFYDIEFESVINLFYIVSIGIVLHGFADFYNRFLGAHGQGKILRNSSFIVGGSLLVFNIVLIPLWGEVGAAITKGVTGLIYFITIIYYYKKFKIKLLKN
jgi:O-antigen/teichoic acid export membrane protein